MSRADQSGYRYGRILCVLLMLLLTLPGCGGCQKQGQNASKQGKAAKTKKQQDEDEKNEKKKREQERPPLELARLQLQPGEEDTPQLFLKPGHLASSLHWMRANHDDVQADFETSATNKNGVPLEIEHTPFRIVSSRPVALPKTQLKSIESFYYVPRDSASQSRYSLHRRLIPLSGARREILDLQTCFPMPEYQFYFVILADVADRYAFIKTLKSIAPESEEEELEDQNPLIVYYRVVAPKNLQRGVPLPSHSLAWTSTAYVLWDNIYPNALAPAQQQAMLDWLHWGGQLVISGPGSLERLKGSFLEPYLPTSSTGAADLKAADFVELDSNWSIRDKKGELQSFPIKEMETVFGVDLQPAGKGRYVRGTGRLVCAAPVGNGRIVVTSFALTDRHALNWKSFDSFFNGCLLARPRRQFNLGPYGMDAEIVWKEFPSLIREPLLSTRMRFFSRDVADAARGGVKSLEIASATTDHDRDRWRVNGYGGQGVSGVAGWTDFGSVSAAARDTLKQAAGITIPESSFVLKILAAYLIMLVPVNWAVFRLIGRVELAWIAAPIMGLIASIAVVRMAQLDIGFARSRTEVATMEIQAGYSRAHLTRYTALYTSLTTNYVIESESDTAVILPFSTDPSFRPRIHDTINNVAWRRDRTVRLSGFPVISNSTGIIHSEQMYHLGGAIELNSAASGSWQLGNASEVDIRDAVVLRRTEEGQLEIARPGDIASKTKVPVTFEPQQAAVRLADLWPSSPVISGRNLPASEVGLHQFADIAAQQLPLRAGEIRLIGWSEQMWKGFAIRPAANQTVAKTLVLVHLNPGVLPPSEPDVNLYSDVIEIKEPLDDEDVSPLDLLPMQP